MKIVSHRFATSAYDVSGEPREGGPEVVFLGRSNVGKSSLINRLLGVTGLARTSSQPGRTQSVNFYRINESVWFVDLPGYGYAKVPEAVRQAWKPLVDSYLDRHAARIALALLVVDARRTPTESDRAMSGWLLGRGIPFVVAAAKADKLSGNERARSLQLLGETWGGAGAPPILVSSRTGRGIKDLWRHLDEAIAARAGGAE